MISNITKSSGSNTTISSDSRGKEKLGHLASLTRELNELKTHIEAERVTYVNEKVAENKCKLGGVSYLTNMLRTKESSKLQSKHESSSGDMLSYRMNNPLAVLKPQLTFDLDSPDIPEVTIYPTAKLPLVEKIPRSTTWVPSDSNKLMAKDQSLIGKRRTDYVEFGGRANIERDAVQPDEQKHQFSEDEKRMIRFVISQEYEPTEDVIQLLTRFIGGTTSEIHEAFTIIMTENEEMVNEDDTDDSFLALFCRQCLLFNCRRHIIRQPVITPAEQPSSSTNDHEEPQSSVRRKNKAKRQKHSGKSVARRPTSRGSTNENRANQYTPCDCKSGCGKDCPCLRSSNCCEKYCGCPKSCRNRYAGCHCTKSQCRGQQCPCRVARRECDPDVCHNCWVSCGGGPLGEPARKEGQCGNMRLLLKQRKRVLMAKSDVSGWGVFLQSSADKDDYIGEYTGELISDEEADVRGNLYKDANTSSFLFNLNDQYVIDPIHMGSKLKMANHSANPNCYAKVMKVAGDHRLGIFAKKRIEAGEELFYDYGYAPDVAPVWALKPDDPNEGPSAPQARARKPPSHRSPVQQSPLHRSLFQRTPVHRSRSSRPPLPRSPLPRSPLAGPPLPPPSPRPPMG